MEISGKYLNISISDNSKSPWESKSVLKMLRDSLEVIEKFIYSSKTRLNKKSHPQILLDLHFCGDSRMKAINKAHRGKDKTTDVLSFPGFESLRADGISDVYDGMIHLGDIIISRQVAKKQAKEFKITVADEVIHLFVHGLLHVLGYDHEISDYEEQIMTDLENKILKEISKSRKK